MRIIELVSKIASTALAITSITICTSCSNVRYLTNSNYKPNITKTNTKSGSSTSNTNIFDKNILSRDKNSFSQKLKSIIKNPARKKSKPTHKSTKELDAWNHTTRQNSILSCHTFVAAGLVEAKYYRSTGKRIDLSEADLFLKHIKKGAPNWDSALSNYLYNGVESNNSREQETGHVHDSYNLIRKFGIAREHEVKYNPIASIGLPLTMSIIRSSIDNIITGIDSEKKQTKLIASEINKIKKGSTFNILSKEKQYFASRQVIKQFTSQYTLESIHIHHNTDNVTILKNLLNLGVVGLNYKVPLFKNSLIASKKYHTVIITGYDSNKGTFSVRDSDYKGIFARKSLTQDFVKKFATKIYYLQKK